MLELLKRKYGPLPVWAYTILGVGILVWWIVKHKQSTDTTDTSSTDADTFPTAQPMPTQSDTFITITNPVTTPPWTTISPIETPHGPLPPSSHQLPPGIPLPTPAPKKTSVSYAIKSGDTLTKIANKYHLSVSALYNANKSTIEAAARKHGHNSSEGGHWIYPGTSLVIPA